MPAVPRTLGVPALRSYVASDPPLLTVDALGLFLSAQPPQWGIFNPDGSPAVVGDSVVAFEFDGEARAADFPIEQGAFASYNKVALPYNAILTFTKGGPVADRAAFLASIIAAQRSLALLSVITPEVQYQNANVVRNVIKRRTARDGVTLLTVEVYCREIRPAPAPAFSNTQSPTSAAQVNDGVVQTQPSGGVVAGQIT